jgi:hypothetical protein
MAGKLRANQKEGFVFEAYAEASSKVEAIKRIKKDFLTDAVRFPTLDLYHTKATNAREQARTRLDPLYELNLQLVVTGLDPEEKAELLEIRERLVGEIFIRLFRIDMIHRATRGLIGA